jgi:hypothetical protein
MRLHFQALVNELLGILGARLVADIAGVTGTRAVQEWAKGVRDPKVSTVP